jgi:hypothetical protein
MALEPPMPGCPLCGGHTPSDTQVGYGWVMEDSGPIPPNADGSPRVPPQLTVKPCHRCRPLAHRRWRDGHLPCPKKGSRGDPCHRCRQTLGMNDAAEEVEHLPGSHVGAHDEPPPPPDEDPNPPEAIQESLSNAEFLP